jgi:signal transduction histidine kinase
MYGSGEAVAATGDLIQQPTEPPLYIKLLEEEEDWRASGILHDFNNQLAIILSHCSIALTKLPGDSNARGNLERAVRATKRAADLSSQLQIGRTAQAEAFEARDWHTLIAEVVEALEPRLTAVGTLEQRYATDVPPVTVIPTLLQRALFNILNNAVDAIARPPGLIQILTEKVVVTDTSRQGYQQQLPTGAYALFQVSDSGEGMTQATLDQIFVPFFTTKATGMGIGLTMTFHTVQLHRGILHIRSKPGEGTVFRLLLPLTAP